MKTLDPGMAGIAHDATGFGDRSTSTRHILMKDKDVNREYSLERGMHAPTVSGDSETVMVTAKEFIEAEHRLMRTCIHIPTIEEPEHR